MAVDGRTHVIPHLAYPSAHVRTPQLMNSRFADLGLNALVVPWEVSPEGLGHTLAAFKHAGSLPGMIVTIPHKEAVAASCDEMQGVAEVLQVANVIRKADDGRFIGALFDGKGFVCGLQKTGFRIETARTLVLGAGGAATAIAHALLEAGVDDLVIANRSVERAQKLVQLLFALFPLKQIAAGPADGTGFDLVVNATSVGLDGDPRIPLDVSTLTADQCVADIIMKPVLTPLLAGAQARGATIHYGEPMLLEQVDLFIDFLLGPGTVDCALRQHKSGE